MKNTPDDTKEYYRIKVEITKLLRRKHKVVYSYENLNTMMDEIMKIIENKPVDKEQ